MSVTETTYQTADGRNEKGYIIDGKTYKDREGTQRIDYGSTVNTAGGTFTYTPQGGVETYRSIGNGLAAAHDQGKQNLAVYRDARLNAADLAMKNQFANIQDERKNADKRYADANSQAYRAYLTASNPYGAAEEQRARLGLSNSGYAESSRLALSGNYQNALSENARQKQEYLNELDKAYREAQYQGDIQKANAIADYEKLVYQHGIDAAEAIANQKNLAYQQGIAANESLWNRERQDKEYADARADEMWRRAYNLASMGLSNEEIAKNLGISEYELNEYIRRKFS